MEDRKQGEDRCSQPPALDDLALIAAIDGEASSEVLAHLHACSSCAARAEHFERLQLLLRHQLFRLFCPTADDLAAFQQRLLAGDRHDAIARHISDCTHCRRELALLNRITGAASAGEPPSLRDSLRAMALLIQPLPAQVLATSQRRRAVSGASDERRLARIVSERAD